MKKKYKLLKEESIIPNITGWSGSVRSVYRLQALRDIPKYGVKRGDLGGLVFSKSVLSHEGSCWIAYGATVLRFVTVKDDAYIGGNAMVISDFTSKTMTIQDNARISDGAKLYISKAKGEDPKNSTVVGGNSIICGNAEVFNLIRADGNIKISGNAKVEGGRLSDNVEIYDNAVVKPGVTISGSSKIGGEAIIHENATIDNCAVYGKAQIGEEEFISNDIFDKEGIFVNAKKEVRKIIIGEEPSTGPQPVLKKTGITGSILPKEKKAVTDKVKSKTEKLADLFDEVKENVASYETDIVKIIKYPVMTDKTDLHTMKMFKLLKKVERLSETPEDPEFEETLSDLEDAFMIAEANALKLAATLLTEAEQKKTKEARQMIAKASNEASTEHEKKIAFVQAFKKLEGIIAVPEIAVDTFRAKIGLQEIEA
jgi:acetyltransferase-like isoleucine patch superfamily enzyme